MSEIENHPSVVRGTSEACNEANDDSVFAGSSHSPAENNAPSSSAVTRTVSKPHDDGTGVEDVETNPLNDPSPAHDTRSPGGSPNDDTSSDKKEKKPPLMRSKGEDGEEGEEMREEVPFDPVGAEHPFSVPPGYIFGFLERKQVGKLNVLGEHQGISGQEWLYKDFESDPVKGIASDSVAIRKEKYGVNQLKMKDPATFWEFFWEACQDPIIIMLAICAVISIIFGMTLANPHTGEVDRESGWIEGTAIIISILVVTLTGSISNYQKAKRFEEMEREQSVHDVQVYRDGVEVTVLSNEIVVGDLLVVEEGVVLDCDLLYVAGDGIKTDEAAMTGEPDLMPKDLVKDPFLLSGTQVASGQGRAMVVAVGMNSVQGQLKESTDEEVQETPMQEHLGDLADKIGKIGLAIAVLLISALFIKEGILIGAYDKEANAANFLGYVIIAVAVVVVAIPEGLPLAVTISLAFSMKSMMNDNCLVRVLASCETMGAATAICSDKTGTLTMNEMSCVQGVVCNEEFIIDGYALRERMGGNVSTIDRNSAKFSRIGETLINSFADAIAFNSTARQQTNEDGRLVWIGNKTEHGLLGFCNVVKRDYAAVRASVPAEDQKAYPFSSAKKSMSTIVRKQGETKLYTKGASEVILKSCDQFVDSDGVVRPMGDSDRAQFEAQIEDMANQGNRTIGVAYGDFSCPADGFPEEEPDLPSYTFLGVLGIQDPIREEVPSAVKDCHTAGVIVRMVTGDNINTAIAIAKKCGIYNDDGYDHAMIGEEFRHMFDNKKEELLELLPRLRILARSSPRDKYLLVQMLQELGEVVGVTGDGTNDAPALKLANVGFAMQIGTDIAKGASDMVLLDNNFVSVVNAIKWGRAVNDNVRKFLQYQLSINVGGVVLTFVGALASATSKEPFSTVQLLWLNLIMDTLAALALATERPDISSLHRLPIFKQSGLMSRRMIAFIGIHSLYQTGLILAILFVGHTVLQTTQGNCDIDFPADGVNGTNPVKALCEKWCEDVGGKITDDYRFCQQGDTHTTIIFNTFIWFQIFNMFNARKLFSEINIFEGFSRSIPALVILVVIVGFQVFAVEVAGPFLDTTGLSWQNWLICIGLGFTEWIVGILVHILPLDEPIPKEIQDKWDKETRLRESLGLKAQQNSTVERRDSSRILRRDPSLRGMSNVRRH